MRLDDYFDLDVRIDRDKVVVLYLSVRNVTERENPATSR